jgi:site-specific DNA-methyltransferase (adenine-specific)/modification methylase
LWALGAHRLLCGDSTNAADVARLMGGVEASACITDPPYGINWQTQYASTFGETHLGKRRNWALIKGDTQPFDPAPLLRYKSVVLWGVNNYPSSLPPGSLLVWNKRLPDGRAFLADAEAAWMKGGRSVHLFDFVWQGFSRSKPKESHYHPTQKPIPLMVWCLEKSKAGATVYDPYCGSGPVLLACERTGRACYGCEIDPGYCDTVIARWEAETGQRATLLDTSCPLRSETTA